MKLRIQDSSVRFRITLKELEQLRDRGVLVRETHLPPGGPCSLFRYSVERCPRAAESALVLQPYLFRLLLSDKDFEELASPRNEGAYIRRAWTDPSGEARRFLVFIEKDRPGSTCIKQEAWIYDVDDTAKTTETRPIGEKTTEQT